MLDLNLALLGLILSIVYSSSEIALLSANALQLDVWEKQKKYLAHWASSILDWKPEYLSVILIGTNLSNILATSFATVYLLRSNLLPHQLIVIPIAIIILLFGEILPKSIMQRYANFGLILLSPFLKLSYYIFFPIIFLLRQTGWMDVSERFSQTAEELEEIDQLVLSEKARGGNTRYYEDTHIGDEIDTVLRGPLSLQDMTAFLVGTGRSSAHGVLLREALRHPDHFFRNPEAGGGLEYTGIGHLRDSVAEAVGVPGAYDYGPQRVSWMGTLVTNWMGDDAFLKRLRVECRRFNVYGDTQYLKGKVIGKHIDNGSPLVDLEIWAENQRGQVTAPGQATVMLPSRDPRVPWFTDGRQLQLRTATRSQGIPPILPE